MKQLQGLEKRIRGWVPEELRISSHQQTENPKNSVIGVRFGILIFVLGFAGALLGGLDAALGLGLFSGFGLYVFITLLFVCITAVAITKILSYNKKRSAKT